MENEPCAVCYRNFSAQIVPMVLACGHSFCGDCVRLVTTCPMCRKRLTNNNRAKTNFSMLSLLEKMERAAERAPEERPVQPIQGLLQRDARRRCSDVDILNNKSLSINVRKTGFSLKLK